jgi:hypothetical protein
VLRYVASAKHNRTSHIMDMECGNVHNWLTMNCGGHALLGLGTTGLRNSRDETDFLDQGFSFNHFGPYRHPKTCDNWAAMSVDQ